VRNLTDIDWPEIYVFVESNTSLVLESQVDYSITPKGRVEFIMKHPVNASASEESDGLFNSLFPSNIHLAFGLRIYINRIIATEIMFAEDVHNWMKSLPLCVWCLSRAVCLFKRLNSCSSAPKEAAASIYGCEIPEENNVLSVRSSLCNVERVSSLKH